MNSSSETVIEPPKLTHPCIGVLLQVALEAMP